MPVAQPVLVPGSVCALHLVLTSGKQVLLHCMNELEDRPREDPAEKTIRVCTLELPLFRSA